MMIQTKGEKGKEYIKIIIEIKNRFMFDVLKTVLEQIAANE
jgi:hypothetical protein